MVRGPRVIGKMGRPAESRVMGGHNRFGLLLPLFLAFIAFSDDPDDAEALVLFPAER